MKKSICLLIFLVICSSIFAEGGSIISNITQVDKKGLTITSKAQMYINAKEGIVISTPKGISITASDVVYYAMVSPAAGTNIPRVKFVYGAYDAKSDGLNVTLSAKATFTNANSYFVILTPATTSAATIPASVSKLSGTVFKVFGDDSSSGFFMAVGY